MLKASAGMLLGLMIALPAAAAEPSSSKSAKPSAEQAAADKATEDALAEFGNSMQALETDVVAKTVPLTTDEATKFWPVFKKFQAEQKVIMDDQIAAVRKYAAHYDTLTDQDSADYVKALLERDQRIHDLRVKYLAEYSKVVSPGTAARVIHVTRRLGLAAQAKLASQIPLVR